MTNGTAPGIVSLHYRRHYKWAVKSSGFGGSSTGSAKHQEANRRDSDSDKFKATDPSRQSLVVPHFAQNIWRAIERLKEKEIPVVISIGAAASGGYYVSAAIESSLNYQPLPVLYVYSENEAEVYSTDYNTEEKTQVETLVFTRSSSLMRAREPEWKMIDETYAHSKTRVADGRNMTAEEVEQVARDDGQAKPLKIKDLSMSWAVYTMRRYAKDTANISKAMFMFEIGERTPCLSLHANLKQCIPFSTLQEDCATTAPSIRAILASGL